ncbi:MAG: sigma-70 family RNA polymerase sigma factor [Acidobacteria bacterium]|nr:sigma-70 family RNA polymerase sigma factor [Acidobacteriota bacterium]MBI3428119.1 sigma-70 family RNA polymerase sigma factor [Acidobacteriota bacterium]
MEISDDQIIERTLAGETDAFGLLVQRWERPIYGLSLRMLGRDEDARDVCQETFLAAFRNLGKFRGDAKFSSWIYRIALNACHSKLRKHGGVREYSLDTEDADGRKFELPDWGAEESTDRLQRDERAVLVRRALQALPAEMRQVLIMKEYHEMTFAEIAEVLQIPVSTVKSRLYTGLQQMRARLDKLRRAI